MSSKLKRDESDEGPAEFDKNGIKIANSDEEA